MIARSLVAVLVVAALCVTAAPADVVFWTSQGNFDVFRGTQGYNALVGTETFEEAVVPPGAFGAMNSHSAATVEYLSPLGRFRRLSSTLAAATIRLKM